MHYWALLSDHHYGILTLLSTEPSKEIQNCLWRDKRDLHVSIGFSSTRASTPLSSQLSGLHIWWCGVSFHGCPQAHFVQEARGKQRGRGEALSVYTHCKSGQYQLHDVRLGEEARAQRILSIWCIIYTWTALTFISLARTSPLNSRLMYPLLTPCFPLIVSSKPAPFLVFPILNMSTHRYSFLPGQRSWRHLGVSST